jgi:phosphoribosylformylglycinamidine synthase
VASHGEGKLVISKELAIQLFENGQIAAQYCDDNGNITMHKDYNPNGANYAIEAMISECGQILGKMGHAERYEDGLFKNIYGNKNQDLFTNGVEYFKK